MSIPPYVEQPAPSAEGFVYARPPHRMDRLMRLAMRFVGASQIILAILLAVAASRLDGGNSAIAGLFAVTFLAGGLAALWWMGRSGGVHRFAVERERIVLQRAGIAGLRRTIEVPRADVTALRPEAVGEGRASSWRLWLVTDAGPVELATVRRTVGNLRPIRDLADRLGLDLRDPPR